jgi:hypothetical protein
MFGGRQRTLFEDTIQTIGLTVIRAGELYDG